MTPLKTTLIALSCLGLAGCATYGEGYGRGHYGWSDRGYGYDRGDRHDRRDRYERRDRDRDHWRGKRGHWRGDRDRRGHRDRDWRRR